MSLDKLKEKLKKNTPDGVYAFFGSEDYTKTFYLKKLLSYAQKSPTPEFNVVYFNDENITYDSLSDAIETPPFMWEYKAICVNGLNFSNKTLVSDICSLLDSIPEGVILVFVFKPDVIDYSAYTKKKEKLPYSQFLDTVKDYGLCVEFAKESGTRLYDWIGKHFAAKSVDISRDAIEFLPAYCGNEMTVLNSEIDKLCSYYSGTQLGVRDVEFVCCPNSEYQIFDLATSVVEKNTAKTHAIMQNFRFNGIAPEIIMGTVAKNFCDMLYVKTSFSENKNPTSVKAAIGMPDWLYKKALNSANKTSISALKRIVLVCSDVDKKLKSFSGDSYTQLELLFCEINRNEKT